MTDKSKIHLQSFADELLEIRIELNEVCEVFRSEHNQEPLEKVAESAKEIGKAWSDSWIGYHANIYYEDFKPPPAGAHFSSEWGNREAFNLDTTGNWDEFEFEEVKR